jgi:uncharacterized protein (UPF0335 family)
MVVARNTVDGKHLRSFLDRIEKLNEEKAAVAEDIKDVYSEAKGAGFDVKVMRKLVSLRKINAAKRREDQEILDCYLSALGMLD